VHRSRAEGATPALFVTTFLPANPPFNSKLLDPRGFPGLVGRATECVNIAAAFGFLSSQFPCGLRLSGAMGFNQKACPSPILSQRTCRESRVRYVRSDTSNLFSFSNFCQTATMAA